MTKKTMMEFIRHLGRTELVSGRDAKLWSLLTMDGYNTHTIDPDVLQALADLRIYCISFPSHTTAELQPCDVVIFASLKSAIAAAMDEYRREHNNPHVDTKEFARILASVWSKSHNPSSICAGFKYEIVSIHSMILFV
jgi:hypothetical protein